MHGYGMEVRLFGRILRCGSVGLNLAVHETDCLTVAH